MSLRNPVRQLLKQVRSRVSGGARVEKRLRVGFVGTGQHARTNLYPCLPLVPVDLMAVCARRQESAAAAARTFGAPSAYADYTEMFRRESLDAVFVCVSAREHFKIASAALERGLHVFVEKPATETVEEAQALREIERRSGRHVMVGLMKRHAPAYRKAREIVASRSFGSLAMIDARFCVGAFPGDEEFVREVGIHHLDLIRYFAGEVATLQAERHQTTAGALTLAVLLRFASGAVGTMRLSSGQSWRARNERVELLGRGQSLVIENMISLRHYRTVDAPAPGGPFAGPGESFWEPNFTVPTVPNQTTYLNGFGFEIEHFVQSLLAGKKPQPALGDFIQDLRLARALSTGQTFRAEEA